MSRFVRDIDKALLGLPDKHSVSFCGESNGVLVFVRGDGFSLRVYGDGLSTNTHEILKRVGHATKNKYSGDISPNPESDGFMMLGYSSKYNVTLGELLQWFDRWSPSETFIIDSVTSSGR